MSVPRPLVTLAAPTPPEEDIVELDAMARRLKQPRHWVEHQALRRSMPHFRVPRGHGKIQDKLTFPLQEALAWHAREFGHNLRPAGHARRAIVAVDATPAVAINAATSATTIVAG